MSTPDLNMLTTLDVLLTERSVARAAKRLRLSPSAMSRALARVRRATGDPLLVRAGRLLVPTPRARELCERVSQLVQAAEAVLRPAEKLNLAQLTRIFTIRTREGFVENFGPELIGRVEQEAPGVRLCFVQKTDREPASLRDGLIDLETGVVGKTTAPEFRTQPLFDDRFIGVVRAGHALCKGEITPARYAKGRHIGIAPQIFDKGLIDEPLGRLSLKPDIVTMVGSFSAALALARASDLIACVPERHTGNLRAGMHSFALPVATPEITVSLLWHPRFDADPGHRWLRMVVLEVIRGRR
jgi:DNA-binding transcriptional LysR family regulator